MKKYLAIFFLVSVTSMQMSAAEKNEMGFAMKIKDMNYVKETTPWLMSRNAGALYLLPANNVSTVYANMHKADGAMADVHESGNSFESGVYTESYVKVSDRMAFYGRLSYLYFTGSQMGGPILIDPHYNFINFDEANEGTLGRKNKEMYALEGGISYRLAPRWFLGGRASFESGNYAKRKDPRFYNSWMDLNFTAGVVFEPSDKVRLGIDAEFRKTVESIQSGIYGEAYAQYNYLVDFGAYFGSIKKLDNTFNWLATGYSNPMVNHFYGGSIQAGFLLGRGKSLYNEVTVLKRDGYYGSRSSGDVRFCDAGGLSLDYKGSLSFQQKKRIDKISLCGSFSTLANELNTYRYSTTPGETTKVEYIGQQRALDRKEAALSLEHEGMYRICGMVPGWTTRASAGFDFMSQEAESFPNYRKQHIYNITLSVSGKKSLVFGKNVLSPYLSAVFMAGGGLESEDGKKVQAEGEAFSNTLMLQRNFEYMTAARFSFSPGIRYERLVFRNLSVYLELSDSYTRLLSEPDYLSAPYRNIIIFTLGCNF